MERTEFDAIARLVNHSQTTTIAPDPVKSGRGWDLYLGSFRVHTSDYPFAVVYLNSKCTREDQQAAARELKNRGEAHVVYASSTAKKLRITSKHFPGVNLKGLWSTREYLLSFLKEELDGYVSSLNQGGPEHFILPRIQVPAGMSRRIPNPLLHTLIPSGGRGELSVLLAEAGHGKSYLCDYLVDQLLRSSESVIPILINSSQWHSLPAEDLGSIWKTIAHSFRCHGSPIAWIEDHEDEFTRVALREQVFSIIFDGFDEYILQCKGAVEPSDVLESLGSLAREAGARILITSRTSFWESNLSEEVREEFQQLAEGKLFYMLPFERQHARNYFSQRFEADDAKITQATQLFANLETGARHIAGRGFVLRLCADAVAAGLDQAPTAVQSRSALSWLLRSLCRREQLRQDLILSETEQLELMTELAVETSKGEEFGSDLLELAIAMVQPGARPDAIKQTVEKLKSHPLMEYVDEGDRWQFRGDQIPVMLVAQHLLDLADDDADEKVQRLRLEPGTTGAVAAAFVDLACDSHGSGELARLVRCVVRSVTRGPDDEQTQRLAGAIAIRAVDRLTPQGSPRADRTTALLDFFDGPIRNVTWSGSIRGFIFSGVTFQDCRFEGPVWVSCEFDDATQFCGCDFVAAQDHACTGLGSVDFGDCKLDSESRSWIEAARVREGRREYAIEDLSREFGVILGKFLVRGRSGVRSVAVANLAKGPIRASPHSKPIIEAIKGRLLEHHHISGSRAGGYAVRPEVLEAFRFYGTNNVLTGPLRTVFETLAEKLNLR